MTTKEWREANAESHRESSQRWRDKNREAHRAYSRAYNERHRERIAAQKRDQYEKKATLLRRLKTIVGCQKCGYREHHAALHFHHRDPSTKSGDPMTMFTNRSMERVKAEIAKCDVLCANCHSIVHFEMRMAA